MPSVFFFALLLLCSSLWGGDPGILYLTWRGDPATTITVVWHTRGEAGETPLSYRALSATDWSSAKGIGRPLRKSDVVVHIADLKGLAPDTDYLFSIGEGKTHRFRTLPNGLSRPLDVAVGGDAYMDRALFEQMNALIASKSPDFAIVGGDLAYTEGLRTALKTRRWKIDRWEEFFSIWTRQMVTPEGRIIPIVPAIGNHDILQGFDDPHKKEVLFYRFFPFPEEGVPFQRLDVGQDLSFYLLDTGHTYPVCGLQTEWLEKGLQERQGAAYRIPVYHLGAYPSETSFHNRSSKDVRACWVPLFEQYGVKICLENDNHTFKRTFPIREGKPHSDGILYLGDGSWGVPPLKPKRHWYLAKAAQINVYWHLRITQDACTCTAISGVGTGVDEVKITPLRAVSPELEYSAQ